MGSGYIKSFNRKRTMKPMKCSKRYFGWKKSWLASVTKWRIQNANNDANNNDKAENDNDFDDNIFVLTIS